jgi:hypothetical protein
VLVGGTTVGVLVPVAGGVDVGTETVAVILGIGVAGGLGVAVGGTEVPVGEGTLVAVLAGGVTVFVGDGGTSLHGPNELDFSLVAVVSKRRVFAFGRTPANENVYVCVIVVVPGGGVTVMKVTSLKSDSPGTWSVRRS